MRSVALLYTLSFLVAAAPQQGSSPDGNGTLSAKSPDVRSIFGMDNLQFNAPKAPSGDGALSQPSNIILTVDTPSAPKEPAAAPKEPSSPPPPVDTSNDGNMAERVIVGDPCTSGPDIRCGFLPIGSNEAATPNAKAPDAAIVSTNTPPPLVASNDGATSEPKSPVSNGNFNQLASPLSNPPASSILQPADARPLMVDDISNTGNDAPDSRGRLNQRLDLASGPLRTNFVMPGQPQNLLMFTGLNGPDTSAAPNGVSVGTTPGGNVMSSTGESNSPPANGQTPPVMPPGSRTFTSPLTTPQPDTTNQPGSESVQTTPEQSVPSSQGMPEPPTNFSEPPPQNSFGSSEDQTSPPTAPATNSVGNGPVPFVDGPVNDPPTLLSGESDAPPTTSDDPRGARGFNPLFNPTNLGLVNTPANTNAQTPPNFGFGAPFQFPGDNNSNGNGQPTQRGMPGSNSDRRNTMLVSPISTPQSTTPSDGSASTVVTSPTDSNVSAGAMPSSFGGRPSMGQFGSSNGEGPSGQFPRPRFGQRRPDENMPWIGENGQFRQLPSGGNGGPGQRNMQMLPPLQQLPRGGPPAAPIRTPWSPQVVNKWTGEQSRYFENGLQSGPNGPQIPNSWRSASDNYFEPLPARPAN